MRKANKMTKPGKLRIWVIMNGYGNGVGSFHQKEPAPLTPEEQDDGKYILEMGVTSELEKLLAKLGMGRILAAAGAGPKLNSWEAKIFKRIKKLKAWKIFSMIA